MNAEPNMYVGQKVVITPPEVIEKRRKSRELDLWKAVWECSQHMSLQDIQKAVNRTLEEIASDEP